LTTVAISSNSAWSVFNFRIEIIRALLLRGCRVVIVAPPDKFSARLAGMGCEMLDIYIDNKGSSLMADSKTLLAYHSLYRRSRPDVALHFTVKPVIYGTLAARWLDIPCVNMVPGLGTVFIRESWLTRVVEMLYRVSQTWPEKVFFENPDDLDLSVGRGLVPAGKVERLPGSGVNLSRFAVSPMPGNEVPVFLLVARLLWDKGVGEFIEAARRVKARNPRVRFQLLGALGVANRTAIPREQVENWVREGVVEYLGETDDVRPYIQAADCVVLPSYREGTPRALLEAAAMGRPAITTVSVGCREAVEDGVTGYLCRAKDAGDLAGKMERFLALPPDALAHMGRKGREKMEREFDERIVIDRYMATIDRALEGRGKKR
jgi:glycosyltransferase involved in cell wall biosynthesis